MDTNAATDRFAALAQATRLNTFRLLVRHAPEGLAAGDIARRMGVPQNTMSSHLAHLARAGLISARRDGRRVLYAADIDGIRELIGYLTADCCGGRAEICAGLLDDAAPAC